MLKLGKIPYSEVEEDKRTLKLKNYIDKTVLPTPPTSTNDYEVVKDWGMCLNDQIGDCAIAGPYHMEMGWNVEGKKTLNFTDANVLSIYSAISGYDPKTGENDNGCVLRDVLKYWKNTGLVDAEGQRHKIGAFVQLDEKEHNEVMEAQYLFSFVDIGFLVPQYAMTQFQEGKPWTVQTEDGQIVGGHCVIVAGYSDEGVYVITWGAVQLMTWGFFDKYCDEAWGVLSSEFLVNGESPEGLNLTQLQTDLEAIVGGITPTPSRLSCAEKIKKITTVVGSTLSSLKKINSIKTILGS